MEPTTTTLQPSQCFRAQGDLLTEKRAQPGRCHKGFTVPPFILFSGECFGGLGLH